MLEELQRCIRAEFTKYSEVIIPDTIFGAPRDWFLPAISKEPDTMQRQYLLEANNTNNLRIKYPGRREMTPEEEIAEKHHI